MTHLECVKKWPAAYTIMAAIMDDVEIDQDAATRKWGEQAVSIAVKKNNQPMSNKDVVFLLNSIIWVSHFNGRVEEVATESQSLVEQAYKAAWEVELEQQQAAERSKPASESLEPSKTYTIPKKNKNGTVSRWVRGTVVELTVESYSYQGKARTKDVLVLREHGASHCLKGTNPAAIKKKLKVGDMVWFWADEVVEPPNRDGWYKYPKHAEVLS